MLARLAEPTLGHALQPSEALGTTINSKRVQALGLADADAHAHAYALSTFASLAVEIHYDIMMLLDPVSQICLGLTCSSLHHTFHTVYDTEGDGYNPTRRPFGLRMQASVCGQYVLNWWYDDWFLRDSNDIQWDRSLGELLFDEKCLWGDLTCCPRCLKFKPEEAYSGFAWEVEMLVKYSEEVAMMEESDVEWYEGCCRRCKTQMIYVTLASREEFLEEGDEREERKSLGLVKSTDRSNAADSKVLWKLMNREEWHALVHNYERWQDIYSKLGI